MDSLVFSDEPIYPSLVEKLDKNYVKRENGNEILYVDKKGNIIAVLRRGTFCSFLKIPLVKLVELLAE